MFDYSKLKGRIIEKYDTLSAFAEALGIKVQSVSAKLTGRINLTKKDVITWSQLLDIKPKDIGIYFFALKV